MQQFLKFAAQCARCKKIPETIQFLFVCRKKYIKINESHLIVEQNVEETTNFYFFACFQTKNFWINRHTMLKIWWIWRKSNQPETKCVTIWFFWCHPFQLFLCFMLKCQQFNQNVKSIMIYCRIFVSIFFSFIRLAIIFGWEKWRFIYFLGENSE